MRKSLSIIICSFLFCLAAAINASAQQPAPPKPRDTTIQGPQTFAMIMGISDYKHVRKLNYADKDAEMFKEFLKSPAGGSLSEDNIYMLLNNQALAANFFIAGFKWLKAKNLQKGDKLFIYMAGHGDAIDEDQFFYLAYDCNPAGDKNSYLVSGAIRMADVKIKIAKETAKGVEVFLIMDACRSNELPGGSEGQGFFNSAISEKRAGEIVMLATGAGQESLEDANIGNGHGLFTYYLVDGLNGMADGDGDKDNKVTVEEIQKYVQKNVPAVAQQQFRRKQDPYFCCTEHSSKVVSIVDQEYLKRWVEKKKQWNGGNSFGNGSWAMYKSPADTALAELYNSFYTAVKESKLTGKNSAEFYYDRMEKKYPGNSYTIDAQSTLAVEFINFAQSKINLYLDCKDPASIQKIRAQIDEDEKTDEIDASLDRMEKVARQEFYEVGNMLEKAISFIMPDDPDFAKSLMGRMYFFKARGYFTSGRRLVDINKAFQYAYSANSAEKNAAYVLHTLASLHLDNNRIDSAINYSRWAIAVAPKWRYPYVTLAYCYKMQNKPDSAIKYYRKSIDVNPENADAYVDLGHYFYSQSKTDSAIANYEKALGIEPRNTYASNNIGWIYHDRKQYEKAISYFKQSIASDPKFINAYNGLGKTFFEAGQADSAKIYYTKAFANYQDKSIVNVYLGNFFRELKQYDSAKTYYRIAAELDPTYEEAFNNLGKASFALKQLDSANIYYQKALVANPYSAFALINIGLVFKEMKQPDSTYKYFQQAVKTEPWNPSILNSLGVIYGQEKNYDSAKKYFRKALNVRPDYKLASNNLLRIFRELNQLDSVTNFLKGSSLMDPASLGFLDEMARTFLDQKRYDSARKYYRLALSKDPVNPQLLNNMGMVFQGMKRYDSAKLYIQKAMRLDPNNSIFWGNLAGIFRQLKEYDSASYYYQKQVFNKADATAQAFYTVGSIMQDMKLYDSAIAYFKRAAAISPEYVEALSNICAAYIQLEQLDSAITYGRRAVALTSTYENAYQNLGLAFHAKQQYDSAIVYLKKSIELSPTKGKNYFQLACSYALNKQTDQAILHLKLAYELGYNNKDALFSDPDLAGLRDIKAYQELLDKYVPNWRQR
ncbi:MAG TPA: tetratricopeptide repeat protein [Chitinophagaceae bacterium]|nr:tetratricopeptide repeat protein [Chitinophagaceae bacterium]